MNPLLADTPLATIAGLALKATAILGAAALLQALWRGRTSAATRHLTWTVVVASLLLLPIAWLVAPRWAFLPAAPGGLGPAAPALDLVAGWHLLEAGPRRSFRDSLGSEEAEWQRGRAWAFQQAMGAVWYYQHSNPAMYHLGRRSLERILADSR